MVPLHRHIVLPEEGVLVGSQRLSIPKIRAKHYGIRSQSFKGPRIPDSIEKAKNYLRIQRSDQNLVFLRTNVPVLSAVCS